MFLFSAFSTNNAVKIYNDNIKSDSFANYFIKHLQHLNNCTIKAKNIKHLLNVSVISKLNPISISKKLGTDDCQLCMRKRIEITRGWLRGKKSILITKNTEIFGAYRHKVLFYVYKQVTTIPGTNEGNTQKKKQNDSV